MKITKEISFDEFANFCIQYKVVNDRTGLRADYSNLCKEYNLCVQVGNDNEQLSFDIEKHTFKTIILVTDTASWSLSVYAIYSECHVLSNEGEYFQFQKWQS
jgi:hypothetical protein